MFCILCCHIWPQDGFGMKPQSAASRVIPFKVACTAIPYFFIFCILRNGKHQTKRICNAQAGTAYRTL